MDHSEAQGNTKKDLDKLFFTSLAQRHGVAKFLKPGELTARLFISPVLALYYSAV